MRAISILTARSMNYSIITGGGKNSSRPHFSLYYLSYSNPVRRFIDKDDNTMVVDLQGVKGDPKILRTQSNF